MTTAIQLNQVVKRFGSAEVIRGVDLSIEPGQFTVFVGPSGSGKSTLLRMVAGLETITDGELLIDGERMNETAASKRGIAMVFQSYALYPHMSVYKNLAFGLETAGYKSEEIENRVQKAAATLKIEQLLQRRPKALSGGQRQRVAIGRAIVREPRIFLFDEPLSNLDAELRVQMRVEISKLHQQLGNTMIYVTHDQVEAMTMADQIVVLRDGLVMQSGPPLELYNNPQNVFVAGFLGSPKMNFLPARLDTDRQSVQVLGTRIALPRPLKTGGDQGEITFGIRPEHIQVGGRAGQKLADTKVQFVEHLGGNTVLYVTCRDEVNLTITQPGQMNVKIGDVAEVRIDEKSAHLFSVDGQALK